MYGMTHQKALKTGIIAAILLVAAILTTTTTTNIQASNNCDEKPLFAELLCGGTDALQGYNQGVSDGNKAGLNGDSSDCPQSDSASGYCIGWNTGYNKGSDDKKNYEENKDNDDNGNNEDDGVPKRTIGDNN